MADKERIEMLDSPQKEIVEFLEEKGWDVLVAGKTGIKKGNHLDENKFDFVMEFTGKKNEQEDE